MNIRSLAKWLGIIWMGLTLIGLAISLLSFFSAYSRMEGISFSMMITGYVVSTSFHLGVGYLLYYWGKKGEEKLSPEERRSEGLNFFMVLGILMMSLSGLCSGIYLFGLLNQTAHSPYGFFIVAVVGGVPFTLGFCVYFLAKKWKKKKTD